MIRGSESYALPDDYVYGGNYRKPAEGSKPEKPIVTVSPDEDLFGATVPPTEEELEDGPRSGKR